MALDSNFTQHQFTSSKFLNQQRKLVYKDFFLFLNKKINYIDLDIEIKAINKLDLISHLAQHIYEHLFDKLLVQIDSFLLNDSRFSHLELFDCIWQFAMNLCKFSKRYLLAEVALRQHHQYFTFNNLIIDKIQELLIKLVEKLSITNNLKPADVKNSFRLDVSSLLVSNTLTTTQQSFQTTTYSLYSIFINEIWLHVFFSYFLSICSKCGLDKRKHQRSKERSAKNKNGDKSSSSIPHYLLQKAMQKAASLKRSRQHNNNADKQDSSDLKIGEHFLVDFSICKKLVNLVQKVFEVYMSMSQSSSINLMKMANNGPSLMQKDFGDLIKNPSVCSSLLSTPTDIGDQNLEGNFLKIFFLDINRIGNG